MATYSYTITANVDSTAYLWSGHGLVDSANPTLYFREGDSVTITNTSGGHVMQIVPDNGDIIDEVNGVFYFDSVVEGNYTYRCTTHAAMTGRVYVGAEYINQGPQDGYGTGPLPADNTQIGVNQIRTKINEIISKGIGTNVNSTAPSSANIGELWFDEVNSELYVYSNSINSDSVNILNVSNADFTFGHHTYTNDPGYKYSATIANSESIDLTIDANISSEYYSDPADYVNYSIDLSIDYIESSQIFNVNGSITCDVANSFHRLGEYLHVSTSDVYRTIAINDNGTTVVMGGQFFDSPTLNNVGNVKVFRYTNNAWTQLGSDIVGTQAEEHSGWSVAISSNGETVAIGSLFYDSSGGTHHGRVRVFRYTNNAWTQLGSDIVGTQADEQSGSSVAISSNGETVAIVSPYYDGTRNDQGRVRVFRYTNNTWTQLGSDMLVSQIYVGSSIRLSMSSDGETVATGWPSYDSGGVNHGLVRVFRYTNNAWTQLGSDIVGTQENGNLGNYIDLSSDGETLAISVPKASDASKKDCKVYNYSSGNWSQLGSTIEPTNPISQIKISGDGTKVLVEESAAARLYNYTNNTWNQIGNCRVRSDMALSKDGFNVATFGATSVYSADPVYSTYECLVWRHSDAQTTFNISQSIANESYSVTTILNSYLDENIFPVERFQVFLLRNNQTLSIEFDNYILNLASASLDVDMVNLTIDQDGIANGSGWIQV